LGAASHRGIDTNQSVGSDATYGEECSAPGHPCRLGVAAFHSSWSWTLPLQDGGLLTQGEDFESNISTASKEDATGKYR